MKDFLKKIEQPALGLSLLFVFLIFLNFRDIPNRFAALGAMICCGFYAIKQQKVRVDCSMVLLGLSMAIYGKMLEYSLTNLLMTVILTVVFMQFGKYLMLEVKSEKEVMLPGILFLAGYSLHGLLNSINYFFYPFEIGWNRTWPDIWTGQNVLATQQCIYTIPLMAMLIPSIIYWKKYKLLCSVTFGTAVFFLLHSLLVLSRTPILAFAVLFAWMFLMFLVFNRNNKKLMKIVTWTVVIGIIAAVAVLALNWNWISEIPFVQNMGKDGGVLNNIRFRAQRSVLMQMFDYPMGNPEMYTEGMVLVHNVWLDMAKKTGLIPFGLFALYTIISFVQMLKMLKGNVKTELKYLLSGVYLAFILYYTVEPALDANIRYIVPWTFINGVISGCNHKDFMKVKEK